MGHLTNNALPVKSGLLHATIEKLLNFINIFFFFFEKLNFIIGHDIFSIYSKYINISSVWSIWPIKRFCMVHRRKRSHLEYLVLFVLLRVLSIGSLSLVLDFLLIRKIFRTKSHCRKKFQNRLKSQDSRTRMTLWCRYDTVKYSLISQLILNVDKLFQSTKWPERNRRCVDNEFNLVLY